jgi:hypothetical protein
LLPSLFLGGISLIGLAFALQISETKSSFRDGMVIFSILLFTFFYSSESGILSNESAFADDACNSVGSGPIP